MVDRAETREAEDAEADDQHEKQRYDGVQPYPQGMRLKPSHSAVLRPAGAICVRHYGIFRRSLGRAVHNHFTDR
jgi:hypothetical protein